MSTERAAIVLALVDLFNTIDGTGTFCSNLMNGVSSKLKFWDEVEQFPSVHVTAGPERRVYQGAGQKDRYLTVTIRCYVKSDNKVIETLNHVLTDLEDIVEANSNLAYTDKQGNATCVRQISLLSIDTDEGVLDPLGVGEIILEVEY